MRTRFLDRRGVAGDDSGGASGPPSPRGQSAGAVAALLAAGYALHVVFRLVLAAGRYGPVVFADETGYLTNARYLAGGAPGDMAGSMFYRGGYALLIAPAYLLGGGPHQTYLLVLGVNALLSSAVFPLLYHLLRRAFRVGTGPALAAAFLAALYPPLVLNSLLAQAETALYPLTLLACVGVARFVAVERRGQVWAWGMLTGVVSGYLYTTHGRTAPMVVALAAALLVAAVSRRDLRVPAAASAAVAGATLASGQALNTVLVHRLWGGQSGGDVHIVLSHLRDARVIENLAVLTVGQYWYMAVGTFGVFALGLCQAVATVRGQVGTAPAPGNGTAGRRRLSAGVRARLAPDAHGGPLVAAVALLSVVGLVMLAGIFLFPASRPDIVVYGRYAEVLVPVFLALGVYRLWTVRPAWRVVAELAGGCVAAGAGFAVFRSFGDGLVFGAVSNSYTTLSLPAMADSITGLHPRRVMAVGLSGAAVLAVFARRLRAVGGLALAAALVSSSVITRSSLFEHTEMMVYGREFGDDVRVPGLDTPQDVGYDVGYYTVEGRWAFPWKLDNTHFVLFDSKNGERAPDVRYVISGKTWPEAAGLGARQVWSEAAGQQAVWLIPSRPPAPLTTVAPR